ncbi:MAG TPA: aldo/keto reductase [Bacteroidales bacterium]|nr:aldo/keto reductase [Bacteroidales bacterium]
MPGKLNRREFITRSVGAGAGSIVLGKSVLDIDQPAVSSVNDPLQKVSLGKTGITTSFLGMGTGFNGWNRSSNITRAGVAESLIRQAYEKGIRFFDCADTYGTHKYAAAGLKNFPREKYTLVTKMWTGQGGLPEPDRPDAAITVDRFRKELNTDYIDLVQLHCLTDGKWTDSQKSFMDSLENLKSRNIIRAHGVSVHSLEAMKAAAESEWVDVIHVRINPYGEAMDSKNPDEIIPVIRKMHESGKGIIGMKLIGNGNFRDDSEKIDNSLRFVLRLGTVDMITVGFEKPEQIDNYLLRIMNTIV